MSLDRFGLKESDLEKLSKPLKCPDQLDYYVTVDGFGSGRKVVDQWFLEGDRSGFFMLVGPKGTGRTTLANYIASKAHLDPDVKDGILMIQLKIENEDYRSHMLSWARDLAYKLRRMMGPLLPPSVQEILDSKTIPEDGIQYKDMLIDAIRELQGSRKRLVAVFENVKNPALYGFAQDIFDDAEIDPATAPLVIFTTGIPEHAKMFEKLSPKGPMPLMLHSLNCDDISHFFTERWRQIRADVPPPFDQDDVRSAFPVVSYPLKKAAGAFGYLLKSKAMHAPIPAGGKPSCWPEDPALKLDRVEILKYLFEFEANFTERN